MHNFKISSCELTSEIYLLILDFNVIGPCPPCPKVVKSKCFCGQTAPATKRCFDKDWSCGKPCKKKLSCGQHFCPIPCHEGNICPPCNKKSVQLCSCKKQQKECHCSEPQWQCEDKCGKKLACGYHMCEVICHEGDQCPPCPLSELRHCPCGKTTYKVHKIFFLTFPACF